MEDNILPPGFRFHPTDEELITHYLCPKVSDTGFTAKAIVDVDLNKCEPWDLPAKASMGEKEWYFFSLKDRKYPTGLRTNRATEAGYWKTTGKDKEIFKTGVLVGMKKTLVFYKGRAPKGEKSNWVMHEYRLENRHPFKPNKEEWVVCRVFKKSAVAKKPQETQSSQPSLESPCDTNSIATEFGDIEFPNLNAFANPNNPQTPTTLFNPNNTNNIIPSLSHHHHANMISNNFNINNPGAADYQPAMNLNVPSSSSLSSWTASLLGSPMNSLLLKAFQFRNNYNAFGLPGSAENDHQYYTMLQQGDDQIGGGSSSSKAVDQSESTATQPEQPFNMDSIW